MKIATACTKPRNDGLFCKPLALLVVGTPPVITAQTMIGVIGVIGVIGRALKVLQLLTTHS